MSKADGAIPTVDAKHAYSLPELIDLAEIASPEGRIAWANAKRSMASTGIDRALYLPVVTFVAEGGDSRSIVPFPKPLAPRGYVTVEVPVAKAQFDLAYTLLDFGRGSKLDGSKALEIASTLRLGRTHQKIAYLTASEFYKAQQAAGQLHAAETILQTAETLLQNAQSQYDNGRATLPDLQNAQAGAAEARFDLATARGDEKKSKLTLTEAIGIEPTADIELEMDHPSDSLGSIDIDVEQLIHAAWKNRPDLLARSEDLLHSNDVYRTARAAYLPKLELNASGGQTSVWPTADFGQLGHANVSTWSVAANLRWVVFDGARSHEIESALAERRVATEEQRAVQDSVTLQVWEAYIDSQTAIEQVRASQSFLAAAQTSYDSSLDAYKFGVRSLVDVVQAERQLAVARQVAVRAHTQMMQSAISLSYATGGFSRQNTSTTGTKP